MLIRPPHPHSRLKYYFNDVVVLCIRNGARGCLRNVDETVTQRDGDRPFAKREAVPARRGKAGPAFSVSPLRLIASEESDGSGKNLLICKITKKKKKRKNSRTRLVGIVRDPRVASVHQFHRQLAHLVPFPKTFYLALGFFFFFMETAKIETTSS